MGKILNASSWSRRVAREAVAILTEEIKKRLGYGGIRKIEKALGRKDRYWQSVKNLEGGLTFRQLLIVLREIGMPLADLEARLFGERNPLRDAAPPERLPTPLVVGLVAEERSAQAVLEGDWTGCLSRLDDLRYRDPLEALRRLFLFARKVPAEHEVGLLAVAGSCYRSLYSLPEARACLYAALDKEPSPLELGDLKQRLMYCYRVSDPERALALGREAQILYSRLGVWRKVGETVLDQANVLYANSRIAESAALCRQVCEVHLENLGARNQLIAMQALALVLVKQQQPEAAGHWLAKACRAVRGRLDHPYTWGHLRWTQGLIEQQATCLGDAVGLLAAEHPFEAASCAIDFCALALAAGSDAEAGDMAGHMARLAGGRGYLGLRRIFEDLEAVIRLRRRLDPEILKAKVERSHQKVVKKRLRRLAAAAA